MEDIKTTTQVFNETCVLVNQALEAGCGKRAALKALLEGAKPVKKVVVHASGEKHIISLIASDTYIDNKHVVSFDASTLSKGELLHLTNKGQLQFNYDVEGNYLSTNLI